MLYTTKDKRVYRISGEYILIFEGNGWVTLKGKYSSACFISREMLDWNLDNNPAMSAFIREVQV